MLSIYKVRANVILVVTLSLVAFIQAKVVTGGDAITDDEVKICIVPVTYNVKVNNGGNSGLLRSNGEL